MKPTKHTGGRFADLEPVFNIANGSGYPNIASPLATPQPDHGFDPSRDRVEEPTPMTFGIDVSGRQPSPCEEDARPNPPASSSSFSRRGM